MDSRSNGTCPLQEGSVIDSACFKNHSSEDDRLLQSVWDLVKNGNEHILSSPLFPPFYALAIDYLWVLVFSVIDLYFCDTSFYKSFKIQKNRKVTWELMKTSLRLQLWNQLLWIYPMAIVQLVWVEPTFLPNLAPTVFEMVWQLTYFLLAFDFSYFCFHWIHHRVKFLYRWCHSVHHMYSSPFTAAAQHLHPFELFFVATFITTVPWSVDCHPLTYWVWFLLAQSISYEVHTGLDMPFALHRFLPFYAGAPAHDMHHLRPLTCFEPWFNFLDKAFGYAISYEDLKKMSAKQSERYGLYDVKDEEGLEKHN